MSQRHNNLKFFIDGYGNITSRRKNGNRKKKPHPLEDKVVVREDGVKVCPPMMAYGVWPQGSAK
jgi:hypothetical protein